MDPSRERLVRNRECRIVSTTMKAKAVRKVLGECNSRLSGVVEDDMPRRNNRRKPGTTRRSPR